MTSVMIRPHAERFLYSHQSRRGRALAVSCLADGRLLLRASLHAAAVRNDIDEEVILTIFAGWRVEHVQRTKIPSDTRWLDVLLARLTA
jgi:hypothetical protein